MKKISLLFLFLSFGLAYSQLSEEVSDLIKVLEKENLEFINHPSRDEKFDNIEKKIFEIATDKEVEYIAYYGPKSVKYKALLKLINSKSEELPKLYEYYINNIDSLKIKGGCVVAEVDVANDLYQSVYDVPRQMKEAESFRKYLKSNKQDVNNPLFETVKNFSESYNNWSLKSAKQMIIKFDKIALDNPSTPKRIIEFICMINQYFENKISYYKKLNYFSKKYPSQIITDYINFCETN